MKSTVFVLAGKLNRGYVFFFLDLALLPLLRFFALRYFSYFGFKWPTSGSSQEQSAMPNPSNFGFILPYHLHSKRTDFFIHGLHPFRPCRSIRLFPVSSLVRMSVSFCCRQPRRSRPPRRGGPVATRLNAVVELRPATFAAGTGARPATWFGSLTPSISCRARSPSTASGLFLIPDATRTRRRRCLSPTDSPPGDFVFRSCLTPLLRDREVVF